MAKKQTRRSISVSRGTYERLKAFCEANQVSMSQFVETRVGDFLGSDKETADGAVPMPAVVAKPVGTPRPSRSERTERIERVERIEASASASPQPVAMTSVAARYAFQPPPPMIKPKQEQPAPKPAEKRPDQIFTF